nr:hypothetical protein [Tanacetum cinerariifolium]
MANHNRIYVTPSYAKKIFGNMRRVGKDFFGRVTLLFSTMMVKLKRKRKKQKSKKPRRQDTEVPQLSVPTSVANEAVNEEMYDSLERAATTATSLDAEQDRESDGPELVPNSSESLRESGEAMSAKRSERQPKGRRRTCKAWITEGRREKSLSSWKSHDTGASYVMVMEPMAWQTEYCIMKKGMSTLRGRKSIPGISCSERENRKRDAKARLLRWVLLLQEFDFQVLDTK